MFVQVCRCAFLSVVAMPTPKIHPTTRGPVAASPTTQPCPPEFYPLPPRGRDPHFGLGRSWYYDAEKRGLLKLTRLRKPGNVRGRVLVGYDATAELIRRLDREARA